LFDRDDWLYSYIMECFYFFSILFERVKIERVYHQEDFFLTVLRFLPPFLDDVFVLAATFEILLYLCIVSFTLSLGDGFFGKSLTANIGYSRASAAFFLKFSNCLREACITSRGCGDAGGELYNPSVFSMRFFKDFDFDGIYIFIHTYFLSRWVYYPKYLFCPKYLSF